MQSSNAEISNSVVLGLQWGDEGKGKVIDLLAGSTDVVVRCQGGANAGHTVVVKGVKTILHLLPSGALHEGAQCVIGNGVVVDPIALQSELEDLRAQGVDLLPRLQISDRAHMVLPLHKKLDAAFEKARGAGGIGTTLRGIGPTYGSKMSRQGLRCGDILDEEYFRERLDNLVNFTNSQLACFDEPALNTDDVYAEIKAACDLMRPAVKDTASFLHQAAAENKIMLFEGAQGVLLDIDYGTYPFVTSSNTGTGGIITGSGLSHKELGEIIGIVKAYTTRVGAGPFPCEETGTKGDEIRERGGEFGATTGRPRRCGWLDLVLTRFSCRLNGVDNIALTKLDVLSGEKELPICVAYECDGERLDTVPANIAKFERCIPVYENMPGWDEDITGVTTFEGLPSAAQNYVKRIEEFCGVRVGYIGVGPDREQTIAR